MAITRGQSRQSRTCGNHWAKIPELPHEIARDLHLGGVIDLVLVGDETDAIGQEARRRGAADLDTLVATLRELTSEGLVGALTGTARGEGLQRRSWR